MASSETRVYDELFQAHREKFNAFQFSDDIRYEMEFWLRIIGEERPIRTRDQAIETLCNLSALVSVLEDKLVPGDTEFVVHYQEGN